MLTSTPENGTELAPRTHRADEIVEVVALTNDAALLRTLREAAGDARRIWHTRSAATVGDLVLAGEVGILVLDTQALDVAPATFVAQLRERFPALVMIVVGDAGAQVRLAGLVGSGTVLRFLPKPGSVVAARASLEAAVRHRGNATRHAVPGAAAVRSSLRAAAGARGWIGALAALACIAGAGAWLVAHGASGAHSMAPSPPPDARRMPAASVPTPAPAGVDAATRERALAHADAALLGTRLDEAEAAIAQARAAGVDAGRIALLEARLAAARTGAAQAGGR